MEIRGDDVSNALTEVQKDSLVIYDPAFGGHPAADQKNSTALRTNWANGNAWIIGKGKKVDKNERTQVMVEKPKIDKVRVFSMFSGIGNFELGIINSLGEDAEIVGFSEIDKYAIQIYKYHFKGVKNYGDATKIKTEELPDFDFLVGGFPCQAFSLAGKRLGLEDTRGTLFHEIARVLSDKRPRYFLLENVKGLISHESGKTFSLILRVFADLGYLWQFEVCNSCHFGVPQNRERVFIIGYLGGECGRQVFPLREGETKYDSPDGTDSVTAQCSSASPMEFGWTDNAGALRARDYKDPKLVKIQPVVATRSDRQYKEQETAPTVRCNDKGDIRVKVVHKNKTGNVKQGYSQTGSVFSAEDAIAPTLDVGAGRLFSVPKKEKDEKEG